MGKFILAPYVRVGFLNKELHFGFGSLRRIITERETQNCILDASVFLREPYSMEELSIVLKKAGHGLNVVQETLKILTKNFLVKENSYNRDERHSRSFLFYSLSGAETDTIQERISKKKIAIVGCGGIGNVVGVLLATAGVEQFVLVDKDKIELSNLSRQIMFKEADSNEFKTQILANSLKERVSGVKIDEIREFIDDTNIDCLSDVDFILSQGIKKMF